MEQIINYVKPELLVVAIALYFGGVAIKKAQFIKDKYIPLILGVAGVLLCAIYVFATEDISCYQNVMLATFTSIAQGMIVAGISVYVNQLIKQGKKEE